MFMSVVKRGTRESEAKSVVVTVDGSPVETVEGIPLAALLLALDEKAFGNSPVSGNPRAPYCMMGVCFDCLVEVDGQPNRQACLVATKGGMRVNRPSAVAAGIMWPAE